MHETEYLETLKSEVLLNYTVEELYDLADDTETSIKDTEELQRWLLDYHEQICKTIIKKEKENAQHNID